ncbi:MAG TPA: GAF domain-containing protein, partial [Ktedonobacteraceae bacterium]|nr:GAF domain-containing protein [Ktedonobacteraceae bacterium]
MSEKKRQQNMFVPLRVRLRPASEQARSEHEHSSSDLPTHSSITPDNTQDSLSLPLPRGTESAHHTQQIKELIRLGNVLRAELGLDEVLQQIVASISAYTGFQGASINLIKEDSDYLLTVAFTGSPQESERLMRERRITVEQMMRIMRSEFRISQSYFIPHEYINEFADIPIVVDMPQENYVTDGWHPEDGFIIPLYSPRKQKLLGFLSLDEPLDGKIPTLENIEMLELFANQAAIAIDSARIFQKREAERVALEEAIVLLRRDLEQVQHGDLRVRVKSSHQKLQPVVEAINVTIEEISEILG